VTRSERTWREITVSWGLFSEARLGRAQSEKMNISRFNYPNTLIMSIQPYYIILVEVYNRITKKYAGRGMSSEGKSLQNFIIDIFSDEDVNIEFHKNYIMTIDTYTAMPGWGDYYHSRFRIARGKAVSRS
jgi:hypothetical protein